MGRRKNGTPIKKSTLRNTSKKFKKITSVMQSISQEDRLNESTKDFNLSKIVNNSIHSTRDSETHRNNLDESVCLYIGGMYDGYPLLFFPEMSSWIYIDEFPMNQEVAVKFGNTYDEQIRGFLSEVTKYFKVAGYGFKEHLSENNLVMYENLKDSNKFIMYFYNTKFPDSCASNTIFAESLQTVNTLYLSSEIPHETILAKISYPLNIIATSDSLIFNLSSCHQGNITNFLYHHYIKDIKYSIIKCSTRTYTPENMISEAKTCTLIQCFNLLDMHYQSLDQEKLEIMKEQEPTYYYTKANRVYTTGSEIIFNPEYEEPEPVKSEDGDEPEDEAEDAEDDIDQEDPPKFTLSDEELEQRYQDDHDTKKRLWDKLLINRSDTDSGITSKKILSSLGIKIKKNKNDNVDHNIIDSIEKLQLGVRDKKSKKHSTTKTLQSPTSTINASSSVESSSTLQLSSDTIKSTTESPETEDLHEPVNTTGREPVATKGSSKRMQRRTKTEEYTKTGTQTWSTKDITVDVKPYVRKKRKY